MALTTHATLYFASGKTLDVVETCPAILAAIAWVNPQSPPGPLTVTKADGTSAWINLRTLERIEPK
jgi:hypothetical protein